MLDATMISLGCQYGVHLGAQTSRLRDPFIVNFKVSTFDQKRPLVRTLVPISQKRLV
jgi:hypothetical protein